MNFYDILKPKYQQDLAEAIHFNNLFNVLLARFDWEGLPENIPQEFLEGILITNGTVGIGRDLNDTGLLWAVPGSYNDEIVGYLPTNYHGQCTNVRVDGKVGEDVAVGWNNSTLKPDVILMQFASILAEIDVSEKCNVHYARDSKIPKAHNEQEKQAILTAIRNIREGKLDAIVSNNVHAKELIEGVPEEPLLELTDIRDIDKLQYLNQYRDNIIKRFFQIYGQKSQVTSKMAQMSVDESTANDSLSMILTLDALRQREKFCDECNRLFGLSMSVKLSKCWADEVEEMDETNDQTGTENSDEEEGDAENENQDV